MDYDDINVSNHIIRDNNDEFMAMLNYEIKKLINEYNSNDYEELVREYVCNILEQIRGLYYAGSGSPDEFMDTLIETQCIVADSLQALRKIISFSFHSKNVEL